MEKRFLKTFDCPCCSIAGLEDAALYAFMELEKEFETRLIITSAYRCEKHNRKVGGAEESYHKKGQAIDFSHPSLSVLKDIANWLSIDWDGGFKFYKDKKFIHIDIGPRRRW